MIRVSFILVEVRDLNKKVLGLALILLFVAMLALPMSMVSATKPTTVNGDRTKISSSPVEPPKRPGESDNVIVHVAASHEWTGGIEGIDSTDATRIMHNWFSPEPLWVNIRAVSTFASATVMGKTGPLTIRLDFRINVDGNADGTWVIIGGTGQLANLNGQGKIFGPVGDFSYSGQVHFNSIANTMKKGPT